MEVGGDTSVGYRPAGKMPRTIYKLISYKEVLTYQILWEPHEHINSGLKIFVVYTKEIFHWSGVLLSAWEKFSKAKFKDLPLGQGSSQDQYRLGEEGVQSSPAKKGTAMQGAASSSLLTL